MINRIKLHDIATYDDVEIFPKKINYLFGGNGTGKTTISNLKGIQILNLYLIMIHYVKIKKA